MTMTGKPGCCALTNCKSSSPDSPGMRISETSTWGVEVLSASTVSLTLAKLRVARFSRARAFSSTQRIDSSSSTIQIGFIFSLLAFAASHQIGAFSAILISLRAPAWIALHKIRAMQLGYENQYGQGDYRIQSRPYAAVRRFAPV